MDKPSMREHSRKTWGSDATVTDINAGSLQRIADATEKMASNYVRLERDLKYWEEQYRSAMDSMNAVERQNTALRGWITRLKKQLKGEKI